MGVRGITSFIKKNLGACTMSIILEDVLLKKKLESHPSGPSLIVDGNSLAYHLYLKYAGKTGNILADYFEMFLKITSYLRGLQSLDMSLIFVFDGPFLPIKARTKMERLYSQLSSVYQWSVEAVDNYKMDTSILSNIPPLFNIEVLVYAISKLNLRIHFSCNEADYDIMKIANENSPYAILSHDSDFLFFDNSFDVHVIPFRWLEVNVPQNNSPTIARIISKSKLASFVDIPYSVI